MTRFTTQEEIDAFVQAKVYGNLLPWEKNKSKRTGGGMLRPQENILRAIIAVADDTGLANREMVRKATGYSEKTHWIAVQELTRKGAIERRYERRIRPKRRYYVVCAKCTEEDQ